ncbi:hypothetical protein, partial [Chitinophaga sp. GbtcB8]|uniref:hypothetical protein n=1 Tax=Chitinophaga sp. GbtcB8 TaxID=2824753 RepID=UPI001C2FB318
EDITEIREGLRFLVNQTPGFSCLSVYDHAEAAGKGLLANPPVLVIMDIALPGATGVDCIRQLKAAGAKMQYRFSTI